MSNHQQHLDKIRRGVSNIDILFQAQIFHTMMLQVLRQAGPWLHDAVPDQLLLSDRVAGPRPLLQLLLRHLQQSPGLAICKL